MAAVIQLAYTQREPISYGAATIMALLIISWMTLKPVFILDDPKEFLTILESPQPPPIPTTPRAEPIPSKTILSPVPVRSTVQVPVITEAPSQQAEMPAITSVPPASSKETARAPLVAPTPSQITQQDIKPETVKEALPNPAPSRLYESLLLAYLEQIKRYPSSREARQTRPQGPVKVWLEISRTGKLLDSGVMSSSGSNLLDSEALKTIRGGNFPPMPEDAFIGQSAHRFTATLKYTLD